MAFLLYFTAIVLSGIAAYYSVIGLIAIFSAAALPVAIMGGSLEAAKLVVASWLYRYWKVIPLLMRGYFITALLILMLITSMGIFGFLSKAHNDQNLVGGDILSKIAIYDEKIKTAKENIDANRAALRQLDASVDQTMARSTSEQGAERSVQIRRQQGPERQRLLREIEAEQRKIAELNEQRAPIAAEVRKVEAEVGPLKYIAALIYDDTADTNTLERAVRWLIILLIVVFDPLAVLMLIAANLTQVRNKQLEQDPSEKENKFNSKYTENDNQLFDEQIDQIKRSTENLNKKILKDIEELDNAIRELKDTIQPPIVNTELNREGSEYASNGNYKIIPDQTVLPLAAETVSTTATSKINNENVRQDHNESDSNLEKVGLSATNKQMIDDKSLEEEISNKKIVDQQVQEMIDQNDQQGLEQIYKKIVRELAKNNRSKSTHWGPIKNLK